MIILKNCIVNTINGDNFMRVKLREVMNEFRRRTGERMTYEKLAERTGLSKATLESLASRNTYNTRLSTIEKLCQALGCQPGDLLELDTQPEGSEHEN
jgi:DNA-binding Xre family transcriptional regulator